MFVKAAKNFILGIAGSYVTIPPYCKGSFNKITMGIIQTLVTILEEGSFVTQNNETIPLPSSLYDDIDMLLNEKANKTVGIPENLIETRSKPEQEKLKSLLMRVKIVIAKHQASPSSSNPENPSTSKQQSSSSSNLEDSSSSKLNASPSSNPENSSSKQQSSSSKQQSSSSSKLKASPSSSNPENSSSKQQDLSSSNLEALTSSENLKQPASDSLFDYMNTQFGKDLYKALDDVFLKYNSDNRNPQYLSSLSNVIAELIVKDLSKKGNNIFEKVLNEFGKTNLLHLLIKNVNNNPLTASGIAFTDFGIYFTFTKFLIPNIININMLSFKILEKIFVEAKTNVELKNAIKYLCVRKTEKTTSKIKNYDEIETPIELMIREHGQNTTNEEKKGFNIIIARQLLELLNGDENPKIKEQVQKLKAFLGIKNDSHEELSSTAKNDSPKSESESPKSESESPKLDLPKSLLNYTRKQLNKFANFTRKKISQSVSDEKVLTKLINLQFNNSTEILDYIHSHFENEIERALKIVDENIVLNNRNPRIKQKLERIKIFLINEERKKKHK
jgi:hypothetical protein